MAVINWKIGGLLMILLLVTGFSYADSPDTGYQMGYGMQGPGIAEPFYPSYIPTEVPTESGLTPEPFSQAYQGTVLYSDPVSKETPQFISPDTLSSSQIVGFSQDPGTAVPYYPSAPPSPSNSGDPVIVTPAPEPYPAPGGAEPYYPVYTPTPAQTPYHPPEYYSPVYYSPSYYYQEPVPKYRYYDKYYRSSCYDDDDYSCYYYSYDDGTLKIGSDPYQAEVYVDNRFRGYTPYSGYLTLNDVRSGSYTVRLKYSGYYDYYEDVYVANGRTTYVDAEMVRIGEKYPKSGSLSVQSEPTGAGVYLNNEYKGFTPVVLNSITPREYTVLVRKEGFSDYVCKVQVTDKQTTSISAILVPVQRTPEPTPVTTPQGTPVPVPTRASLFGGIVCFSLLVGALLFIRK